MPGDGCGKDGEVGMNENIERVLAALDGFRMSDEMTYSAYSTLHDKISLLDDLLKEQEPRVLTLEEVIVGDECWFEYINGSRGYADVYVQDNRTAIIYRTTTRPVEVSLTDYMKKWRCWSYRPTEEQRKAVKWNDACQVGGNSSADSAGGKAS